jgi:polyisoprenyl-teichoic acid--peptidoglycan teichoic acid transferase
MGILRKSNIKYEDNREKTPVSFTKKKRRSRNPLRKHNVKKWAIVTVVALVVGAGAYFGISAYNSIKNIFAGNAGILNLLGGSQGQLLKGEIDGRVNVLLLGVGDEGHAGSTLSDTIILASYDTQSKAVSMISIPRDFYAKIPNNGYTKINAAHAYGEQRQEGGGPETAVSVVEEVVGVPIHYYARVDFTGLEDIVDALGGIQVDVERDFCDYAYEGRSRKNPVCFKAGLQTMNGKKALEYSRSRKALGPEGSDFARSKRQQNIIVAIKEKALTSETALNPAKILAVLESLGKHVKTNLGMNEIARVYEISKGINTKEVIQKNLDPTTGIVEATNSPTAGYILIPTAGQFKYSEIHEFVKNVFATLGIKREGAKVSLLNGTWQTLYYTNLYDSMETDGYSIVEDGGARTRDYTTSQIIDYTNGQKSETIRALEKKLGVIAKKSEPAEGQNYEIRVIIGSDFKGL